MLLLIDTDLDELNMIHDYMREIMPENEIIACDRYEEAWVQIGKNCFDIIIINDGITDIDISGVPGYRFVGRLRENSRYRFTDVILIGNEEDLSNYGLNELHFTGMIRRPVHKEALIRNVRYLMEKQKYRKPASSELIWLKSREGFVVIHPKDVLWFERHRRYFTIHTRVSKMDFDIRRIGALMKALPEDIFIQINKYDTVNIEHITMCSKDYLRLEGTSEPITVGTAGRQNLKKLESQLTVVG